MNFTRSTGLVLSAVQLGHGNIRALATWTALAPAQLMSQLRVLEEERLVKRCGETWQAVGR